LFLQVKKTGKKKMDETCMWSLLTHSHCILCARLEISTDCSGKMVLMEMCQETILIKKKRL